jgi:leucyl aminopeptidase
VKKSLQSFKLVS